MIIHPFKCRDENNLSERLAMAAPAHRDCSINDTMPLIMTLLIMTIHRDCSINDTMSILIMTKHRETCSSTSTNVKPMLSNLVHGMPCLWMFALSLYVCATISIRLFIDFFRFLRP